MSTLAERFEAKVCPEPNTGCHLWTAATVPKGYGKMGVDGKTVGAHRVAWFLAHGAWPELFVLHRCDTPACCNPAHLFLGTNADNVADMVAKGRVASGERHGLRKHPERAARGERSATRLHPESRAKGEEHGSAKLTEGDVLAIRDAAARGVPNVVLARHHRVCPTSVGLIVRRKTWRHVA